AAGSRSARRRPAPPRRGLSSSPPARPSAPWSSLRTAGVSRRPPCLAAMRQGYAAARPAAPSLFAGTAGDRIPSIRRCPVRVVVPAFRRGLAPAFTAFAVLALAASAARASGPLLFQHGGRATAQAGAFVGRATDAGGLDYNPAVIARLRGSHYQLGLDYTAPVDDYKSSTGSFRQEHLITESPSIYASWHLPEDYYPLAFGIGVDHRAWYRADWEAALFPGRFQNRLQRLELWSVHPVVAYQLGERWSVGAGLRYYTGKMEEGRNQFVIVPLAPSSGSFNAAVEVERNSDADVDGQSFDVGLHYGA